MKIWFFKPYEDNKLDIKAHDFQPTIFLWHRASFTEMVTEFMASTHAADSAEIHCKSVRFEKFNLWQMTLGV